MVTLALKYDATQATIALERTTQRGTIRVLQSMRGTAVVAGEQIKAAIARDLQAAGNFGPRWIEGIQVSVTEGKGATTAATGFVVEVSHKIPFFEVFRRGALIKGRPLLWIPLSFAPQAKGVYARNYPGRLFRVDRLSGAPLLLAVADKQPKYVGLGSVRVPKKLDVEGDIQKVVKQLKSIYQAQFRASAGA